MVDVDRAFTALLQDVTAHGIAPHPDSLAARASARRSRRIAAAATASVVLVGGAVFGLRGPDATVQPAPADRQPGPLTAETYDQALLAPDELPDGPDGSWAPWRTHDVTLDYTPFDNPCGAPLRDAGREPYRALQPFKGAGGAYAIQDVARWRADEEARRVITTVTARCRDLGLRMYSLDTASDAAFGFVVAGPATDGEGSHVAAIGVVGSDIVNLSLFVSTDPAEIPMRDVADSLATALERLGATAPMPGDDTRTRHPTGLLPADAWPAGPDGEWAPWTRSGDGGVYRPIPCTLGLGLQGVVAAEEGSYVSHDARAGVFQEVDTWRSVAAAQRAMTYINESCADQGVEVRELRGLSPGEDAFLVATVGRLGESQLIGTMTALARVGASTTVISVSFEHSGDAPLPIEDMKQTVRAALAALSEAG